MKIISSWLTRNVLVIHEGILLSRYAKVIGIDIFNVKL